MSCFFRMNLALLIATATALSQIGVTPTADDTTLANQYFAKAERLAKSTQYDSSNFYYDMAAAIYVKTARQLNLPRIWERYIACYNDIGANLYFNDQYDKAVATLKKALDIGLKIFGENHPAIARSYHRMGNANKGMGDREQALEFWNKALAIRLKTLGENHPEVAFSYGNIGIYYADNGDVGTTILYYEKVLNIFRQAYGENHPDVARAYENMGVMYGASRYYDGKDFECFDKALTIRLKVFGENHPETARANMNLALYYTRKHAYEEALGHFNKTLDTVRQKFGENHLQTVAVYHNLGLMYFNKQDYQQALAYFNKALSMKMQLLPLRHPGLVSTYQKLGEVSSAQKEYDKALTYFQKSILCLVADFADTNYYANPILRQLNPDAGLLSSLRLKAEALQDWSYQNGNDLKKLQATLATFKLVMDLIDKMRNDYKADASKLALQENFHGMYEKAIQASLQAYDLTKDAAYKEQAFRFAERGKAAVLAQLLQESHAKKFSGIPANWQEKERKLKMDLTFIETAIEKEKRKNETRDQAKLYHLQNRYFALKVDYDKLLERLDKNYPRYYTLKYKSQAVSIADLQRTLDGQTAVLEYFSGESTIFVFAVTKQEFAVVATKKDSSFAATINGFPDSFKNITSKLQYLLHAAELYQILIKPLESQISSKSKLVIIPDGSLHQIPFEALLTESVAASVPADYHRLSYLIKQHEISYHYSATLFLKGLGETARIEYTNLFAGFAPVFDATSMNGVIYRFGSEDSSATSLAPKADSTFLATRDGKTLDPLPYSAQEVRDILSVFPSRSRTFIRQEASEENFKQEVKGYKYVHVATHGRIVTATPKLSNLTFSQPQDNKAKEDGILYSGETYNLDLNADLLVLSACQTGAGQIVKGEGLMSLTRGFLYSGARNIVASLWKVHDEHTSRLMVEFYRQISAGKSYSAALREAKLKMITIPETAAPQSWAGFVLIGK